MKIKELMSKFFTLVGRIQDYLMYGSRDDEGREIPSESGRLLRNSKTGKISINYENPEVQKDLNKLFNALIDYEKRQAAKEKSYSPKREYIFPTEKINYKSNLSKNKCHYS